MANTIPTDGVHQEDKASISVTVAEILESAGTIAAADTTQGTGTAVPYSMVWVTGADGTKGVTLPAAIVGRAVFLKNDDAANAVLKVYPASGETINAIAANSPISMALKTSCTFMCTVKGQWHTIPLVPS